MAAACAAVAVPHQPELQNFRAPVTPAHEHVKGFLWIEAEGFADYGNWRLDTQFTHKMGSAYLIAPGVLKPIGEVRTKVAVPRAGTWRVWVRTKDWLPEFSPGRFTVAVGGKRGAVLGASKREGWIWEKAGDFSLAAGETDLALVDLSGAFARCDAVLLTTDLAYEPPVEAGRLLSERRRLTGQDATIADGGAYDVVVVGAGTAGMGATLAAARTGAKTALVHDRPVMGGNSSVELGIGTDGAAGSHPNKKLFARETGLCEEVNLVHYRTTPRSLTSAYAALCAKEPNLATFANQRVFAVEKRTDGGIAAVLARDTLTGRLTRYRAKLFIDCTGDGWVGVFADAERMFGREAQREFNEAPAPEERDDFVMSGCLMDGCLAYRYARGDSPVAYETPAWARVLPPDFTRGIRHIGPQWWIEHGGRFNECADPERARDELVRIVFAYWGWVKNESKLKADAANAYLTEVPFMNGRREGYRLVGDYVLTANDALEGKMFDDRISYGGWPLDTHDPLGMENAHGNGYWKHHPGVPVYSIPFRSLYSKNVPNLMMAGRDASVTHIALGSVRVEATLFTLGQAAGTGAALALARGLSPREYGRRHIRELQQRLLKDDMYIPELKNEDPHDLARQAQVTATSVCTVESVKDEVGRLVRKRDAVRHELAMRRATAFRRHKLDRMDAFSCLLESTLKVDAELTARVYGADVLSGKAADRTLLATAKGTVRAGTRGFVAFRLAAPLTLAKDYVWIELMPKKGVAWYLRTAPLDDKEGRAYGGADDWTLRLGEQYAFAVEPRLIREVDSKPEYVIDGVARQVGSCMHGWVSDPEKPLPQTLTLSFEQPVVADSLRLTFDTDLTPTRVKEHPHTLVRDYEVEVRDASGAWRKVVGEKDNGLRLRVHGVPERPMSALRVTVTSTWGDKSARIQEVRLYREGKASVQ